MMRELVGGSFASYSCDAARIRECAFLYLRGAKTA